MKKRMIAGVLTLLLAVGALSGCSSSGDNGKTIVVGAKGFSENLIVAELYALALEDLGYTVERQYSLNTLSLIHISPVPAATLGSRHQWSQSPQSGRCAPIRFAA